MPITGLIPDTIVTLLAVATLFAVMFTLGSGIGANDLRWTARHPTALAKGLFSVLVVAPAIAIAVSHALGVSREAEIGIVLMAICPGAPIAFRRSMDAGAHRSFAPALQISLALIAVISMPLSIAALDAFYAGNASIAPQSVAKQVLVAQLLPMALGYGFCRALPRWAARLMPHLDRLAKLLLLLLIIVVLIDVSDVVIRAGSRISLAIVITTVLLLAVGQRLGGADPSTQTAVAISSAMRNAGLALLVATANAASPDIVATVLAYVVVSAFIVLPYVAWRRRRSMQSARSTP
jgi:BASS family bile acid:Na+ symporter